jgi:predicted PurR-regulated permease PerM
VVHVSLARSDRPRVIANRGFWGIAARVAMIGTFVLFGIVLLYFSKTLVAPVLSAAIISTTLGPLAARAAHYRVPPVLFAMACVLTALAVINIALIVFGSVVAEWAGKAPELASAIGEKAQVFAHPLSVLRDFQRNISALLGSSIAEPKLELSTTAIVSPIVQFMSPAVGELVLFFGSLFFFIVSRASRRQHLILMFRTQDARLRALRTLNVIELNLARYVVVVSAINIALGTATALIAYVASLPNPLALGLLACLLNYIPYVGPALVTVILFVVGLVALPSISAAVFAPVLFIVTAFVEGQLITPGVVGRQLTMSPLSIFLSLAFWTWLWGPLGTLLATPFLISMVVIREYAFPDEQLKLPG